MNEYFEYMTGYAIQMGGLSIRFTITRQFYKRTFACPRLNHDCPSFLSSLCVPTTNIYWKHMNEYFEYMTGYAMQMGGLSIRNGLTVCSEEQAKTVPIYFPTNEIARNKICSVLPRLRYGSFSGSISLSHLSIFYNISCYNSLVLLTFVSRSSCRFT
jgi:hypothetical protein